MSRVRYNEKEKNPFWGKKHSLETKQKMSAALKGRTFSAEHRQKLSEARRGEKHYNWKGGRRKDSKGYILIYRPDHPRAHVNGYVYEHILLLEEKLGRALLPGEVSHHINGCRDDNRSGNLTTFPSKRMHMLFHHKSKRKGENGRNRSSRKRGD